MTLLGNSPLVTYYNGVTFPTETETVSISGKPTYDQAGRAVVYILYTITLRATIATANQAQFPGDSDFTTDASLSILRKRLQAPGGEFHYENVGFGNLIINVPAGGPSAGTAGTARDVEWGPKPTLLQWKPHGQLAAEILWTVEVRIPECDPARFAFALMEFNYRLEVSIDTGGYSRRVYSGFLRIPQTRVAVDSRILTDHADRYREQINLPLLSGFRRTPGDFTLDESKCRLDFTITDEEIGPNYPPPGVVEVSMEHTVGRGGKFLPTVGSWWEATLSASYEMARDTPRALAYSYFTAVLKDRIRRSEQAAGLPGGIGNQKAFAIVRSFQMREPEVYGRKGAAFACTYALMTSLNGAIAASGLWTTPPRSDWAAWAGSMGRLAWTARGNAQLAVSVQEDAIIDLCYQVPARPSGGRAPRQRVQTPAGDFPRPRIDPNNNWLVYEAWLWVEEIDDTIAHKTLPRAPLSPPGSDILPGGGTVRPPTGDFTTLPGGGPEPISKPTLRGRAAAGGTAGGIGAALAAGAGFVQTRTHPTYYAHLTGLAVRAGGSINPPSLVSVGGQAATPANLRGHGFAQGQIANWFGVPIIAARWRLRYLLAGRPSAMIIPAIPLGLGGFV